MPRFAPFDPTSHGTPDHQVCFSRAQIGDEVAIARVLATSEVTPSDSPEEHAAQVRQRVAEWIADPGRFVVVATRDDLIIGYSQSAWLEVDDVPSGYVVAGLAVAPYARRRGVGAALLRQVTAWTWERAEEMYSIVNATNAASLALHAGAGFLPVAVAATFAGITFEGGRGVLLQATRRLATTPSSLP